MVYCARLTRSLSEGDRYGQESTCLCKDTHTHTRKEGALRGSTHLGISAIQGRSAPSQKTEPRASRQCGASFFFCFTLWPASKSCVTEAFLSFSSCWFICDGVNVLHSQVCLQCGAKSSWSGTRTKPKDRTNGEAKQRRRIIGWFALLAHHVMNGIINHGRIRIPSGNKKGWPI